MKKIFAQQRPPRVAKFPENRTLAMRRSTCTTKFNDKNLDVGRFKLSTYNVESSVHSIYAKKYVIKQKRLSSLARDRLAVSWWCHWRDAERCARYTYTYILPQQRNPETYVRILRKLRSSLVRSFLNNAPIIYRPPTPIQLTEGNFLVWREMRQISFLPSIGVLIRVTISLRSFIVVDGGQLHFFVLFVTGIHSI